MLVFVRLVPYPTAGWAWRAADPRPRVTPTARAVGGSLVRRSADPTRRREAGRRICSRRRFDQVLSPALQVLPSKRELAGGARLRFASNQRGRNGRRPLPVVDLD